ncbi:MAG: ATP-binding protein [Castellaniella sp.]|uniref:ATP-binding protein n=1 Tax=Castellaniella sp. TaxID=1955812 RepID=UPI003A850C37
MDGLKRRLNESVQLKLSLTLFLAILGTALVAGAFSFLSTYDEAQDLQDDMLRQIAQLVERQPQLATPAAASRRQQDIDDDVRVTIQRLERAAPAADNEDDTEARDMLPLPASLSDGLHTLEADDETFRVLVRTTASGERIAVSQESDLRNEIASEGAFGAIMPLLILMPVLLLIVAHLVRKMFHPIAVLSREIDQRAGQELHAIEAHRLPVEVRPFAVAINRLLARVRQSMDDQRRFVADAAHELRSPLTALSLQAERLAQADMSSQAHARLAVLRRGIARGRNLLDQLLALARAQSATAAATSSLSIQAIFRRVLEDLMPLAEARHIDLGVEGTQDARVQAGELDLIIMIRNLVDNAIRYTPEGGRVDLSVDVTGATARISIQDDGPGIALAERQRVFDPFYRTLGSEQPGSGLGLSIVLTIARRIGAQIHLDFADPERKTGLRVTVTIPAG